MRTKTRMWFSPRRRSFRETQGNLGVDGVLQLAPHTVFSSFWLPRHVWRKRHSGAAEKAIYSYYRLVGVMTRRPFGHYADFEAVYTGWHSNTGPAAIAYAYNDPLYYERWLTSACARTAKNTNLPEPIVLLKSWNDWAHGATLLPDKKFGLSPIGIHKEGSGRGRPGYFRRKKNVQPG